MCIDVDMYVWQDSNMNKKRRITANLPGALLKEATSVTHAGITETIIMGLKLIKRTKAYEKAASLKGKLHLDIDLDVSRERYSH